VDVYIPGCPPRPESVIDAVMLIQQRIKRGERNAKLYDRTQHPLDFAAIAMVSDAQAAPAALTGTIHSLPVKDVPLQQQNFGPEREVTHVERVTQPLPK
jgi:coenzyme F420-reducing hydrogenase gamma subunit